MTPCADVGRQMHFAAPLPSIEFAMRTEVYGRHCGLMIHVPDALPWTERGSANLKKSLE